MPDTPATLAKSTDPDKVRSFVKHLRKLKNCVPFVDENAGVTETMEVMEEAAHLILALLERGERCEKALRKISDMDYRGNRSMEQNIAYAALKGDSDE